MAEFTHTDLRSVRESRKMKRWELANEVGVSEDTIRRWESGETRPEPDDVGNIERALKMPGIWHRWMMSHYDSYRERHGDISDVEHITAQIVRMRHEMQDVMSLFDKVERDSLDGKLDNPGLRKQFKKEVIEAVAAMQQTVDRLPDES